MTRPPVTDVRLVPSESGTGLVGFVSCKVGPLRLDGIVLRRTQGGRLVLSFPCRRDRRGRRHPLVRPIGTGVETAILAALSRDLP